MIGGLKDKVVDEIGDALVRAFAKPIRAAGAEWEETQPDADRDLYVSRRFAKAILGKLLRAIGL